MKKNSKSKTYILIFLVLLVWGVIGFKFFSFKNNESPIISSSYIINEVENDTLQIDTIKLLLNYMDPFRNKITVQEINETFSFEEELNDDITKKDKEKENVQIESLHAFVPKISYSGMVKNLKQGEIVVVMNIAGNDYLMKQNDEIENVILKKVYKDSVLVKFNSDIITVKK